MLLKSNLRVLELCNLECFKINASSYIKKINKMNLYFYEIKLFISISYQ